MKAPRWKNAPERLAGGLVALLVLFCVGATTVSIYYRGLGSDAAAWVQAGGSIAAIAGAAWLAGADARRQRRSRRQEREEVAWGVRFALVQAKTECHGIAWEFVGPEAKPAPTDLRHWRLRTEVSKNLLRSYAARTDHIHPSMVHVANNGLILLDQLDDDLDKACSYMSASTAVPEQLVNDITWYVAHFEQLILTLDERMRGIILALDEGNDMLPVQNYEEWKVSPEVAAALRKEKDG